MPHTNTISSHPKPRQRNFYAALIIAASVGIAGFLLSLSMAATGDARSIEPENGSGDARIETDQTASNSKYLLFGVIDSTGGGTGTTPPATGGGSTPVASAAPGISKGMVEDSNAQFSQDATDMQNAGVKWMRGWMACGNTSEAVEVAKTLQAHGITFLPTYNCDINMSISTFQQTLAADMDALKPYGVHVWEIGNEMDGGWTPENNYCNNNATPGDMVCAQAAYLEFQKAAYSTIHTNDPQGALIYGGLSNWSTNIGPWLAEMKKSQAWQWMDGMGYHPYGSTVDVTMASMDDLKTAMSADPAWASKPIWITEVGCWSSGLGASQQSPCSPQSEEGKASYIVGLMDAMKAWNKGTTFEIRSPICWYILHENSDTPGYGLLTTGSRTLLPAYTAYKNYAGF